MASDQVISLREFGRRNSVSDTSIRKAIGAGRITQEAVVYGPGQKVKGVKLNRAQADWDSYERKAAGRPPAGQITAPETQAPDAAASLTSPTTVKLNLAKLQIEVQHKKMLYDKARGTLVERDRVYKLLFEAGQEMRESFLSMPDRLIDQILGAATRNEAHAILLHGIHETLTRLADIEKREISTT
jgi:hypothetical protein